MAAADILLLHLLPVVLVQSNSVNRQFFWKKNYTYIRNRTVLYVYTVLSPIEISDDEDVVPSPRLLEIDRTCGTIFYPGGFFFST